MKHWGLHDTGFDYDIVAVFGSQSTGKSEQWLWQLHRRPNVIQGTLLNRVFGTNFDVMDETQRQQTTKGFIDPQLCTRELTDPKVFGCAEAKA